MKKRLTILLAIIYALTFTSCKVDDKKSIDIKLLKSDWICIKYNYLLYFNDSNVFAPPYLDNEFVYNYRLAFDTLSIFNKNGPKVRELERFKILYINPDVLVLKKVIKKSHNIDSDTITLVNTSTFNENNYKIRNIVFRYNGLFNKYLEIKNDSLKCFETKDIKKKPHLKYKLSPSIVEQLNSKMKLIEQNCNYKLSQYCPDGGKVYLKIQFKMNNERNDSIVIEGCPLAFENLRISSFIAYLNNLDEIIRKNEKK